VNKSLEQLNSLDAERAAAEFLKCCGATEWARAMAERRPFADADAMFDTADDLFGLLSDDDWMEAFRAHPRIGEQKAASPQSEIARQWSAEEQSHTVSASASVMAALGEANQKYERQFGFIFIVCATGKSAEEMLSMINTRLTNPPAAEFRIAAKEQKRITQLRLQKLLDSLAHA